MHALNKWLDIYYLMSYCTQTIEPLFMCLFLAIRLFFSIIII